MMWVRHAKPVMMTSGPRKSKSVSGQSLGYMGKAFSLVVRNNRKLLAHQW